MLHPSVNYAYKFAIPERDPEACRARESARPAPHQRARTVTGTVLGRGHSSSRPGTPPAPLLTVPNFTWLPRQERAQHTLQHYEREHKRPAQDFSALERSRHLKTAHIALLREQKELHDGPPPASKEVSWSSPQALTQYLCQYRSLIGVRSTATPCAVYIKVFPLRRFPQRKHTRGRCSIGSKVISVSLRGLSVAPPEWPVSRPACRLLNERIRRVRASPHLSVMSSSPLPRCSPSPISAIDHTDRSWTLHP